MLRMCLLCLFVWLCCPGFASAKDVRVALLIGHQEGWKGEPSLRYVLDGDVRPLSRLLTRIGFEVKVLNNPTPSKVRKAFLWARRRVRAVPRVTTFLFYYSGHADRKQLHLGRRTRRPVTHKHLVQFFRTLPVKRRIALIDACFSGEIIRQFGSLRSYQQVVRKGARRIRALDLTKTFPQQGEQSGLQILSSSLDYSWESKKHKASIFTYHLLKGLRGQADRDLDGKISVAELFDFASDSMAKEVRQKPLMFGVVRRVRTYALAPAYHSRLLIGPKVVGTIRVSVANFFWSKKKRRHRPVRLAVVHGQGLVHVRHKGRCWRQKVYLPKGREARLQGDWKRIRCQQSVRFPKGSISLPAKEYIPPPLTRDWSLGVSGGMLSASALGRDLFGGGEVSLRHRFGGLLIGAWGASTPYADATRSQLALSLRLYGGMEWELGAFSLAAGVYMGGWLILQDINTSALTGFLFQTGALLTPTWWFSARWGLQLTVDANVMIGRIGGEVQPFLGGRMMLGLRFLPQKGGRRPCSLGQG